MKRLARKLSSSALSLLALGMIAFPHHAKAQAAAPATKGQLRAFFVDVEGGQATLFVTPEGQSLLIDTGWPGNNGRDADRIAAAAKLAGVSRLNYVLLTHYHEDHAGGVPQLLARLPVDTFLDHGPNRELDHGITEKDFAEYQKALATGKEKRLIARPGQTFPIGSMSLHVISADGQFISKPLAGAGQQNTSCAASPTRPADQTENSRSLGVELTFGRLKILDLGDLTWDKEMAMMCPTNVLGHMDVYIVSHHGWYQSSSPALVHAIHPRVAIMDNGEKKGGSVPTMETLSHSPGLEALWQLHFSGEGGSAHNTPSDFIANLQGSDPGNYLELIASPDGSFSVFNSRTGASKTYAAAKQQASTR